MRLKTELNALLSDAFCNSTQLHPQEGTVAYLVKELNWFITIAKYFHKEVLKEDEASLGCEKFRIRLYNSVTNRVYY